ncbi:hypothetical protein EST38_g10131 [Candolleomyces aberdarensis]|uniref:Uncharacterized protein n=1 Tax=Candolleomyces aberdarensis TaxID=2316362 RepID=A0A4Q2D8U7_9AGAR|nr:hypothetical protein EST38_g10131 [Candolleomyces aberdarensis]
MAPKPADNFPVSLPRTLRSQVQANSAPTLPRPPVTPTPSRRTPAQVQKDKEDEKVKKREEARSKQLAIVKAAENENRLLENQRANDETADHPVDSSTPVRKVTRPRPQQDASTSVDAMDIDNLAADDSEDPSEYEDNIMLSDDDEDLIPERRRKKGEARQVMEELKQYTAVESSGTSNKRDRSSSLDTMNQLAAKKSKGKKAQHPSGLRKGWNAPLSTSERNQNTRQSTHASSHSKEETPPSAPAEDPNQEALGGISDDEEGESSERAKISVGEKPARFDFMKKQSSSAAVTVVASPKPQGHTRVVETTSVPEFLKPSTAAGIISQRPVKKSDIKMSDIPRHLALNFTHLFLPKTYQLIANNYNPWYQIQASEICDIFGEVFPSEQALSEDMSLLGIVTKLTTNAISTFRNKFASQALKTLENTVLPALPLIPGSDRESVQREWVQWALSGEESKRVFYYREYEELEPNQDTGHSEVQVRRTCKRALGFYETGQKVMPGRPLMDFSKSNWGDNQQTYEGKVVPVQPTTKVAKVVKAIDRLKDAQKLKGNITQAAIAESKTRRQAQIAPTLDEMLDDGLESDIELVDDDL